MPARDVPPAPPSLDDEESADTALGERRWSTVVPRPDRAEPDATAAGSAFGTASDDTAQEPPTTKFNAPEVWPGPEYRANTRTAPIAQLDRLRDESRQSSPPPPLEPANDSRTRSSRPRPISPFYAPSRARSTAPPSDAVTPVGGIAIDDLAADEARRVSEAAAEAAQERNEDNDVPPVLRPELHAFHAKQAIRPPRHPHGLLGSAAAPQVRPPSRNPLVALRKWSGFAAVARVSMVAAPLCLGAAVLASVHAGSDAAADHESSAPSTAATAAPQGAPAEQAEAPVAAQAPLAGSEPEETMAADALSEAEVNYQRWRRAMARGQRHMRAGEHLHAAWAFERAADFRPGNAASKAGLGSALLANGDTRGAIRLYRQAIALAPEDAELHVGAARAYVKAHAFAVARRSYERALKLEPGYAPAAEGLKRLQAATGTSSLLANTTAVKNADEEAAPVPTPAPSKPASGRSPAEAGAAQAMLGAKSTDTAEVAGASLHGGPVVEDSPAVASPQAGPVASGLPAGEPTRQ